MNVEKTIEFILEQQAQAQAQAEDRHQKAEARYQKAEARMDRADRRMDRLEASVRQLVRYGVSLRADVRRHDKAILRVDTALERLALAQAETDGKLNALIDIVDKTMRNGKRRR
jgi:chromosome segregation ATPase